MLTNIENLITELASLSKPVNGYPSALLYKMGVKHGITCREVKEHIVTEANKVSRGQYAVVITPKIKELMLAGPTSGAKKSRGPKKIGQKSPAVKTTKVKKVKDSSNTVDTSKVVDTEDENALFAYVATEAELAEIFKNQ